MDDKTAEIPSLKNFTAQNKKQNKTVKKSSAQSNKQNNRKNTGDAQSRQRNSKGRSSQSADTKRRETGNRAERTRSTSAPAPRTYARQRQDVSEAIARTQVVNTKSVSSQNTASGRNVNDFSSEPLYRQRSSQRTSDREMHKSSQNARRPVQTASLRTSTEGKSQHRVSKETVRESSGNRKPTQKKQKRPISPRARKFRKTVINAGLCLCVIIIGAVLSLTVLFKTESITVSGNGNIPKNDIINASGLSLGENIFTAPKGRAEERLEKIYPYIAKADVKSVFPNGISIEITMADPACVVEGLGGYYIVSGEGKVLEVSSSTDEVEAPVIEGVNVGGKVAGDFVEFGTTVVGEALKEMFTAFSDLGAEKITAINVTSEEEAVELKYVYDNRIVVYLGIPEHITYKVKTAHTIIKEKIDTGGTMIAGDLDVSMCHDSMKSYFNQYTLLAPNSAFATEPETTAPEETVPATEVYYY